MGCASSQEDVQEISYGPVAGQKKQFIEAVNVPTQVAQKKFETPKYVKVSLFPLKRSIHLLYLTVLLLTSSSLPW